MTEFIQGIYCYCDQWCDRCAFTGRCAVFVGSEALQGEDADPQSEAFWKGMMEQFASTHSHIPGIAEWEFELRQPTEEELAESQKLQEIVAPFLADSPVLQLAKNYGRKLGEYLDNRHYWSMKARKAAEQVKLGILQQAAALAEVNIISEAQELLRWYGELIPDRLAQAVLAESDDAGLAAAAGDAVGSAKVVLIALDRSREALRTLLHYFKDEDYLLPLLGLTEQVDREIAALFPTSRAFVRPGFDE